MSVESELKRKLDDDKKTTKPRLRCAVSRGYKYSNRFVGDRVEMIEIPIFFDEHFVRGAIGWGQWNKHAQSNVARHTEMFCKLVGEIANRTPEWQQPTAITCEMIPKKVSATAIELNLNNSVLAKDYELYERLKRKKEQTDYIGFRLRLTVNFDSIDEHGNNIIYNSDQNSNVSMMMVMEPELKNNNHQSTVIAPRVSSSIPRSLADYVEIIIYENTQRYKKDRHKPPNSKHKPTVLDELTRSEYFSMVESLIKRPMQAEDASASIKDVKSKWNPVNAFRPLLDVIPMALRGAAEECCNGDLYTEQEVGEIIHKFPFDSKHVYRIRANTFTPETQNIRYLPHITFQQDGNLERSSYLSYGIDPKVVSQFSDEDRKQIKVGLRHHREHEQYGSKPENVKLVMEHIDGYDSCAEEEIKESDLEIEISLLRSTGRAVIDGIDLLPGVTQSAEIYDNAVMQQQSSIIPDFTIEQFEIQSKEIYERNVKPIPERIPNPEYTATVRQIFTYFKINPDVDLLPDDGETKTKIEKAITKLRIPQTILNPSWLEARRVFLFERCIDFHRYIWHEDAFVPDVIKAICMWGAHHLKTYNNFCMPNPKNFNNLSCFGDMIVGKMAQQERFEETYNNHTNILLTNLACLQVYFDTPFHAHILFAGLAETGKSRTQKKAAANMIDGTFDALGYETLRAKTGSGFYNPYQNSQRVEFYEEIPPSMIGIGVKDESDDRVAMTKALITSGKLTFSALRFDADGKRITEKQTIDVNNLLVGATNANFADLSDPIKSRFITVTVQNNERIQNGGGAADKVSSVNKAITACAEKARLRWKRDQYLTAKTAYFLKGVSCMLQLNSEASEAVMKVIAHHATEDHHLRGLGDGTRKLEQLGFLTTSLACLEANHVVFDSDLCTFQDMEDHPTHFLQLVPYWRTTQEHAVFALGLLEHQFENKIAQNVGDALAKYIFDDQQLVPSPTTGVIDANDSWTPSSEEEASPRFSLYGGGLFHGLVRANLAPNFGPGRRPQAKPLQAKPFQYLNATPSMQITRNVGGHRVSNQPVIYSSAMKTRIEEDYTCISFVNAGLVHHGSIGFRTDVDMLTTTLAKRLASKMVPTASHKDIKHVLQELTEKLITKTVYESTTTTNSNNNVTQQFKLHPLLTFDLMNGDLKILTSHLNQLRSQNRNGLLKQCITKYLSHEYARETTFLYGATIHGHPDLCDIIKIKPIPGRRFKLANKAYCTETLDRVSMNSIKGVTTNKRNQPDEMIDEQNLRADNPVDVFEMDLDEFYIRKYNKQMGLLLVLSGYDVCENDPMMLKYRVEEKLIDDSVNEYPDFSSDINNGKRLTERRITADMFDDDDSPAAVARREKKRIKERQKQQQQEEKEKDFEAPKRRRTEGGSDQEMEVLDDEPNQSSQTKINSNPFYFTKLD